MTIHPKISIITVVYNDKAGLELTAKSIISQSQMKDLEWIIIDADSTDGTKEVISQYKEYTTYAISEPDNGIYDAMNKGIRLAKGEYILFINAGDALADKHVIEEVIKDPVFGSVDYISGNTYFTEGGEIIGKHLSPEHITGAYFFCNSLSHQSTLIKTKKIKETGYDTKYSITADAKFFFEDIIIRNASYYKSNIFISKYDVTGVSSNNANLTNRERECFIAELLPKRILEDYSCLVYGETVLEKINIKLKKRGIRHKLISLISILLYSPTAIANRVKLKFKSIKRKNEHKQRGK